MPPLIPIFDNVIEAKTIKCVCHHPSLHLFQTSGHGPVQTRTPREEGCKTVLFAKGILSLVDPWLQESEEEPGLKLKGSSEQSRAMFPFSMGTALWALLPSVVRLIPPFQLKLLPLVLFFSWHPD